jgi:hypothetical protein
VARTAADNPAPKADPLNGLGILIFSLCALPSRQKALKRWDIHDMTDIDNSDFLQKHRIDFPSFASLGVILAEPVSYIPRQGYSFSDDALQILGDLVAPGELGPVEFNRWLTTGDDPGQQRILFFLDGLYHLAHHIWAVRNSKDEIAMTSYLGPSSQRNTAEDPPPVGLLYVADVPTLAELALRSPFLGQLLPIADGPDDGMVWAYFLGRLAQAEATASESAEAPREKDIALIATSSTVGAIK